MDAPSVTSTPPAPRPDCPRQGSAQRESTTLILAAAAVPTALVAMFGDAESFTPTTVICALIGLMPWALVAGGIQVRPLLFALMAFVPAFVIIVVDTNLGGVFPMMLLVVWITRLGGARWLEVGVVTGGVTALIWMTIDTGAGRSTGSVFFVGGIGISWLSGLLLRRQETLTAQVRAMRDVEVERRAADERAHLAREVHDVVAHSLTVVMLNLTGARRALATDPVRADEALERAETVGCESLDSIRQVMDLLREPGSATTLPQPTLVGLPQLVEGYRNAGLDTTLTTDGDTSEVDPTVELVVYRLVQESLANVLQHAAGAAAAVELVIDDIVVVTVTNGPGTAVPAARPSRAGLGTRGMSERVRAVGGRFDAGPAPDGGWQVRASVPVTRLTEVPANRG